MKKTLRGKRYIRSRHTINYGRDKRRLKKLDVFLLTFEGKIKSLSSSVSDFSMKMSHSLKEIGDSFRLASKHIGYKNET